MYVQYNFMMFGASSLSSADKLVEADTLPTVLQCFNACPTFGKGEHRLQVCFFSATLHSDAIQSLTKSICQNPTWVDLKGKDAIPETVHHVVYRIDLNQTKHEEAKKSDTKGSLQKEAKTVGTKRAHEAITDGVHVGVTASTPLRERQSQQLKEMKQHVLLQIVDKFQVRGDDQKHYHHQQQQQHQQHPLMIVSLLPSILFLPHVADVSMHYLLSHQRRLQQFRNLLLFPG